GGGRYRRRMRQRLHKGYCQYGRRWQPEPGISVLKRRLGAAVQGRSYATQCRELMLLVLTYNLMLDYPSHEVFYRAHLSPFWLGWRNPLPASTLVYSPSLTTICP